jgi:hypothetical protein
MLRLAKRLLWLVILMLLTGWTNLLPCSCNRAGPACEAAWKADAVFLGTVARIYPLTICGFPLTWPLATEWRTTFTVKEHFSGPTEGTIEVFTDIGCCACGMKFQWGQDYLIYAYRIPDSDVLTTNLCSRTSLARNAVGDLAYLRSLPSHPPPTHIYGFVTTDFWDAHRGDQTTAPVAGVPIHLTSKIGKWVTATDSMGAYSLAGLPGGAFSWYADLPGKSGRSREILLHEHGCSQQIVLASGK